MNIKMDTKEISVVEAIASININSGGTAVFMSDLCKFLPDYGSISLLTSSSSSVKNFHLDDRVNFIELSVEHPDGVRCIRRAKVDSALSGVNQGNGSDLIHLHGIWLNFSHYVVSWSRRNQQPLVVSPHGMLEPWALNHKKFKKKLAWWLYQKRDLTFAKAFHACSTQEAEHIRALGFKQPIAVIPNGVLLPQLPSECEVREVKKLAGEKKTALFLSRINPKKGLPMLLDVWAKLAPKDWRLVIAGNDDSDHLPVLQRKIQELDLSSSVEIVGPLFGDDKTQAYLNADIFVLPSYSENFGIVVTEALGYQVPVLTTTGCPWEELQTERCGWWVEPTPVGIEKGLKAALEVTDEQRSEMGVRGRELVKQKYLWPAIAANTSDFYQWLLGKGDQPDFVV